MKKAAMLLSVIMLHFAAAHAQADKPVLSDNQLKTFIDSAVHKAALLYKKDTNTNGVSIGILYKRKKYVYNYGEVIRGSGKLPTADHLYNLGSVAKLFVTNLLAQIVVEKRAGLTDDIRKYLAGKYPNLEYKGYPVRLLDLANHTSGLPKEFHHFSPAILDSLGASGLPAIINYLNGYNQDSLLADLHQIKPDTIPGTKYQYNGNAMMLLRLLIERIYQQPYEQLVTSYLKKNFGMHDTKTQLSEAEIQRMAQGYNDNNQPQQYINYSGFTGGPSMNSTINDMLTFLEANLAEKDKAIKLTHQRTWGNSKGFAIGLGWMMNQTDTGERYIYHDGQTGIGFNTHCIFYPESKIGIIIIVNDIIDQDKVSGLERNIKLALDSH